MKLWIPVRPMACLAMASLAFGLAPALAATPDPAAEADRFLRLHVDAVGGESALRGITSRRSEGSLVRHGTAVPMVSYQQSPNLLMMETRFARPGTLRQGFDGTTAWVLHPLQGGRRLAAAESKAFASQAWLHPSLHLAEMYPVRRLVGLEKREGTDVVVLALGRDEQTLETWCFDAATHRLFQIERRSDGGPQGEVPVVIRFEDYRAVDGIQVPFTVRTRVPAFETVLRLDKVEHNIPLAPGLFRLPSDTSGGAAECEEAVRSEMSRRAIPGLAAAVVKDRKTVWSGTFGTADLENGVPVTSQTVFRFASVSKPITAAAALRLVQDHRLSLDQPVSSLIPQLPDHLEGITVRHLLSHQSGLRHYRPEVREGLLHHARLSQAFLSHASDPLLSVPGTRFQYSTHAYALLGWVMEVASKRSFLDELRAHIFSPAGMTTARADDLYEVIPHRSQGYFRSLNGELRNSQPMDPSDKVPGGGLCGTILDLAAFAKALQGDDLLPQQVLDLMWTPQRLADGSATGYGLGWYVEDVSGQRHVHHGGTQPRASSLIYLIPDQSLAVAILSNLEQVDLRPLARRLIRAFGGSR